VSARNSRTGYEGEATGRRVALWLCALLTALYFAFYLANPALPGNNPAHPLGWWGWFDQSQYIASARALARFDFSPDKHWYPPTYALLAAPFARVWPAHPWILVNLLSLLAAAWLFVRFAERLGVGPWSASALFVASAYPVVDAWVEPWTSTPAAAALWAVMLLSARLAVGHPSPFLLGLAAGAVVALRPSDALAPAAAIAAGLLFRHCAQLRALEAAALRRAAGEIAWIAAGGAVPILVFVMLHVAAHGFRASPYMVNSADIGFSIHAFGWKAFNLLIEPRAWWGDGVGLLQRAPWIGLALLLLPFALRAGPGALILALAAIAHVGFYVSYVDLLPTGLWRYRNVHYVKWALPGFALLAWLGVREGVAAWRDARAERRLRPVLPALAMLPIALLLSLRWTPERVSDPASGTARAFLLRDLRAGMHDTYHGAGNIVTDRHGPMPNITMQRYFPAANGTRVLLLRRDVTLPAEVAFPPAGAVPPAAVEPYRARITLGWPCWLPPYGCKRGF
jgi:hypothetical protein